MNELIEHQKENETHTHTAITTEKMRAYTIRSSRVCVSCGDNANKSIRWMCFMSSVENKKQQNSESFLICSLLCIYKTKMFRYCLFGLSLIYNQLMWHSFRLLYFVWSYNKYTFSFRSSYCVFNIATHFANGISLHYFIISWTCAILTHMFTFCRKKCVPYFFHCSVIHHWPSAKNQ